MVAMTLTAEEIRTAPTEVRHWLEQQYGTLFGTPEPHSAAPPLSACTPEEAAAILTQIQGLLPVVAVFFELGRETAAASGQGVRALSLPEMARHARLRAPEQVLECLRMINQVLAEIRQQPDAAIAAVDGQGRCFVADATSSAILGLWQQIVAARDLQPTAPAPG